MRQRVRSARAVGRQQCYGCVSDMEKRAQTARWDSRPCIAQGFGMRKVALIIALPLAA
jgi:hypothetical protein